MSWRWFGCVSILSYYNSTPGLIFAAACGGSSTNSLGKFLRTMQISRCTDKYFETMELE